MRMKELSLRQDPDLRKELAQLARGCDFVLPSRFKKRLRAFQQGQAGVFYECAFKHWSFCDPSASLKCSTTVNVPAVSLCYQ